MNKSFEKKIEIYTDGACKGNPGIGGWGAILKYGNTEKEIKGFSKETTNNIMELTAVIKALESLINAEVSFIKQSAREFALCLGGGARGGFRPPRPKLA